ncbi:hypothetical protein CBM2605_B10001 [Cupriavidus neocaledonicus]|uniref:Uncharacterized protein n=1 Tax=Cupriavidus neocaledonicus TaxID=1040979 RepID=A0ABY1V4X1_9BURK|nr:hypothetical protein CBM2605_B10001 [Cupriavidus neocaledonicus]
MQCRPGSAWSASALAEDAVEVRRAAVRHAQVERAFDVFQVFGHQRAGARGIALLDGVDQLPVLVLGTGGRAGAVVQCDDQAGQRHHLADQLFQDGVAGHLGQQDMELARQADHRRAVAAGARVVLFHGMAAQAAHLGGRDALCQFGGQRGLDHAARLEHLARFVDGRAGDKGAAVGHQRHQLLVRQARKHLADARPAGAGDFAQPLLDQLGARQQAVLHDGVEQAQVDRLGGRSLAGGAFLSRVVVRSGIGGGFGRGFRSGLGGGPARGFGGGAGRRLFRCGCHIRVRTLSLSPELATKHGYIVHNYGDSEAAGQAGAGSLQAARASAAALPAWNGCTCAQCRAISTRRQIHTLSCPCT